MANGMTEPAEGNYPQPVAQQGRGMAIAGMVCGIVGLVIFGFILGPLGIIFGGIGWSRANKGAPGKGMAIAGVVLGVIDLAIFVALISVAASHHGSFYYRVG